ncbi:MAG: SH3 domain-containing protein [Chloroflexota bacterium]
MLQQFGGLWRWLQEQSPVRQAVILATPIVVVALVVLGGLMAWAVSQPTVRPAPTVVSQGNVTPTPAGGGRPSAAVASSPALPTPLPPAATQAVLVPGRQASPAPAASPTLTPTPEPTQTPTPAPARSARVVNTDGEGANMRRAPSVSAPKVKVVAEGAVVELIGGEQRGDGYTWRNIRDVDGSTGFIIDEFLQPLQGPPGATPVLPPPSIQVEDMTVPAVRGKEAIVKIVTRPGVRCELRVLIYGPEEEPTEGLGVKTADADGFCTWTWKVPEEAIPGNWRYRISAGEGETKAVREISIVIS